MGQGRSDSIFGSDLDHCLDPGWMGFRCDNVNGQ